jgi:hypothetical protein
MTPAERDVKSSRRRPLRRRATPRELRRAFEEFKADALREHPGITEAEAELIAGDELERATRRNPQVERAQRDLKPLLKLPDRDETYPQVELAAALCQAEMSGLMRRLALTTAERGAAADLSGAAAALALMAFEGGPCIAQYAFDDLLAGSVVWRWALGQPAVGVDRSTMYRRVIRLTGRGDIQGHDHLEALVANIAMLMRLAGLLPGGERVGQVALCDATRLRAPVSQHGPNTPGYMEALRRTDMEDVETSVYRRDDRVDIVVGWKLLTLTDLATGCPIVWVLAPGASYEPTLLTEQLLPLLFRVWPDCPLHTLVADAAYDTDPLCRNLVERWAIQPITARASPRRRKQALRDGRTVEIIDGRPRCKCGPMRFHRREGFLVPRQRQAAGLEHGEAPPPGAVKQARVRWVCPSGLCDAVDLFAHADPSSHTYWPRDPDTRQGAIRRVFELSRNTSESKFSVVKHNGIGTRDNCPLWARDQGIRWLASLHEALSTARTLAHVTGDYRLLAEEYQSLGLHTDKHAPTQSMIEQAEARRPEHLRWRWPAPGRARM